MNANAFLDQLQDAVQQIQTTVYNELKPLSPDDLNTKPGPGRWSALECLEHLNLYSRYYNPAFAKALQILRPASVPNPEIGYSWLGKKSLDIVRPNNGKPSKTVKHMNPEGSRLSKAVLDEFLEHQAQLLELLITARRADLNRKAVPVEFFRLLKLRTGEALEFVVLHQERHMQQALRALRQTPAAAPILVV